MTEGQHREQEVQPGDLRDRIVVLDEVPKISIDNYKAPQKMVA